MVVSDFHDFVTRDLSDLTVTFGSRFSLEDDSLGFGDVTKRIDALAILIALRRTRDLGGGSVRTVVSPRVLGKEGKRKKKKKKRRRKRGIRRGIVENADTDL